MILTEKRKKYIISLLDSISKENIDLIFNFRPVTEMSKSNKEKKDKLHKVKSAKDKRKENKTFLKNIKTNYQDQEFLDSLENKE